jgi:hypothetical protein
VVSLPNPTISQDTTYIVSVDGVQKCDVVYQHVFDSYWDDGHSVYDRAA